MKHTTIFLILISCIFSIPAHATKCPVTSKTEPFSSYQTIIVSAKFENEVQTNQNFFPLIAQFINAKIEYELLILKTLKGKELKNTKKVTPNLCHTNTMPLSVGSFAILSYTDQGWKIEPFFEEKKKQ